MSAGKRLRVLVVDDHDVVQWGLRVCLVKEPWVERCLATGDPDKAVELANRYQAHVALTDVCLGEESGTDLCARLCEETNVKVILMSGVGSIAPSVAQSVGAMGFVSKGWSTDEIAQAVRMVGLGMSVFRQDQDAASRLLSEREREVLALLASGATNREIAATLFLSPHTVKDHTKTLYRKMDARNRAEALVRAQRMGLVA